MKETSCGVRAEAGGCRRGMAVICRCAAQRFEVQASLAQRGKVSLPVICIRSGNLRKALKIFFELRKIRINDRIGTKCRNDSSLEVGRADCFMMRERIQRRIRGR